MAENGFLRAKADRNHAWRLVWLLGVYFDRIRLIIHFGALLMPYGQTLRPWSCSSMTAIAATGYCAGVIQNGQQLLRPHPALDIHFFVRDAPRRLHHVVVLRPAGTELAFPVLWNLGSHDRCTQVRNVTIKVHRTFAVAILHLAIGRTHPAQRLNAALHAFRHSRALARS
jgi:hypothetical protein